MTNVEKVQNSIDRLNKRIDKAVADLNKLGYNGELVKEAEEKNLHFITFCEEQLNIEPYTPEFNEVAYHSSKIGIALDDLETLKNYKMKEAIEKDARLAAKEQKQLSDLRTREEFLAVECDALDEFLNEWEAGFIKWAADREEFLFQDIEELARREKEDKKIEFLYKVAEKAGSILDASFLRVAGDGSLNGYVKGTKATVKVQTILAGGWNIQRLHYRVLVN